VIESLRRAKNFSESACRIRPCLVRVLLLIAVLPAGCMIGPDFKRPPAPVARNWIEASDTSVAKGDDEYRNWWAVFNDPILIQLIKLAYQQNLTLRTAGVRVLEARAQLGIAIGEFYPQQQLVNASLSYNRIPISVPYNLISNTYLTDSFGAQAAWELDVWGKLRRGIESADDAYLASVADYDDVLVTLTGDVASTYVQIRTLETQIDIAHQNVERQKNVLKIVNARHENGVVTGRDVDQAETVLGETEATVPQLTIQLNQQLNALAVLLGLPPGYVDALLGKSSEIPTAPERVTIGIPADLMRRRPDIRKAELQAAAQCAQIGVAKGDLLPAFTLLGNVDTVASNVGRHGMDNLFVGSSLAFSVGPGVQWNLFNYGQITNNVRYQDAKFQELLITYQNSVLKAQQEVENGLSTFIDSKTAVVYLKEAVQAAKGALTIATIQYKEGIADFTTVLTAEQNLLAAQNNLATATGAVPLGLIATYRAMGGGWQIRDGHDFVPLDTQREMANRTNWGRILTPDLLKPQAPGLPSPRDQGFPVQRPEW
jgi:NodT family efflux transporter outer membrane factor (OMF) lipoprotein